MDDMFDNKRMNNAKNYERHSKDRDERKTNSMENSTLSPINNKKRKTAEETSSSNMKSDGDFGRKPSSDSSANNEILVRRRTRTMSDVEETNTLNPNMDPTEFRLKHQITVTGKNLINVAEEFKSPDPMLSFANTPFALPIRRALEAAGFQHPTPTQAQSWPIALAGRDIITVAKTGSGKTCGFLLPAFHRLLAAFAQRKRGAPGILVLAPTRELACQIEEEAIKFGRSSNIRAVCLYGGSPKSLQIRKLQAGVEIIIATPGRLNDLLEMKTVNLTQILFLVLDEADRMLDMGFEPQIRTIIEYIPKERQTMFFTATWPREVQALAREFLTNPIEIKFGDTNNLNANKAIKQHIIVLKDHEKKGKLIEILKQISPNGPESVLKSILFVSRKSSCETLANELWNAGYYVDALHGDKQQFQRTRVMDQFKAGKINILVATDVAARGLDVKDIQVVINYDFPCGQSGVEDYVHRIGRTARGSAEGIAYTFFTEADSKRATQLIGVLKRAGQDVPEDLMKYDRRFGGGGSLGGGGRGMGGGRGGRGGGRGSGFRGSNNSYGGGNKRSFGARKW